MEHKLAHQQRLLQKMSLTPQMRQSIQLLSLSVKDLNDYIDTAISKNPFLQKIIDQIDAKKYRKSDSIASKDELANEYQQSIKETPDPRSSLLSQIRMMGLDDKDLEIAEYLIYELDDNGYLAADIEEVASDLGVAAEDIDRNLDLIQNLDPPGIGARDMRECLELQLKRAHKEGSLEYRIVESFLNEVARNDVDKLSKELAADKNHVRIAMDNIKKLNPRPASTMLSQESAPVIPDLIARFEDKKVRLELNRRGLPQLKIYNPYENELDIIKDPEARNFLKENMDYAKSLMDNLKRREETICNVADYIINFQKDALHGKGHEIKSLTIKDVAAALGFHTSTISRAVSNKFIQINDKVLPLKSLLSQGMIKDDGEMASKTSIKNRMETLIKNEDKSHPLSDNEIQKILRQENIKIERRTIAKYRKALRILPIYLRKKLS